MELRNKIEKKKKTDRAISRRRYFGENNLTVRRRNPKRIRYNAFQMLLLSRIVINCGKCVVVTNYFVEEDTISREKKCR